MVRWRLHNVLFLMLYCSSNGQRVRFPGGFGSFDEYLDIHSNIKPQEMISHGQRFVLLAPDLLRTDSQENIYLQGNDLSNPVTVSISILDQTKSLTLLRESATLSPQNKFQTLKTIQLSSDRLNRDEKKNKFVYLKVTFEGYYTEEKAVMVSFHSGYIFIQTDKPIYNPGDIVRFRAFVSSPFFKAFDNSISVDIQNSDGVVVKQFFRTRAANGVFADTFTLSEIVNEGTWAVIAKFDHWQQNTFTSKFEVKKYVLPAFNVTLTPKKSFLSVDDSELAVEISAKYLYGEYVQGTAYVVFGVMINQEMRRLPTVKQLSDLDGGVVKLSMDEIKKIYPNIITLVGSSLYVKASVLTNTGSDLVEATKTGIKIVDSPYVISFKDTAKYFKPGLPFDFTIQVSHHDGSPVPSIPVKINLMDTELTVSSGTAKGSINMPRGQHAHTIIAETTQTGLRPDQQARQQIIVYPYKPFNSDRQNYLYISPNEKIMSVGGRLSLDISIRAADQEHRDFIKHITYLVINKGKIINAQRVDVGGQQVTNIGLMVTSEMMPSFRVVAFFSIPWVGREEVVSDSVWIDVADSCIGGLHVGSVDDRHRDYAPGKNFRFQIKGDPGAKVGLVAVDNAVYLLSKERLTQRKIWDTVENGDIGCTRGGGRDATGVFTDAGLLYLSSAGFQTEARKALQCPGSTRKRRSAELLKRKARLESHYKEMLQRRCCKDGLRDIPMPYSCMRRSLYITEGWDCMLAFRYCCATYKDQVFSTEIPTTPPPMTIAPITTTHLPILDYPEYDFDIEHMFVSEMLPHVPVISQHPRGRGSPGLSGLPGRGVFEIPRLTTDTAEILLTRREFVEEDEGEYQDETEIYLRFKFYESWLWMDLELPGEVNRDGLASTTINHPLPDSITEWGILAISASSQTGFCVAEPYNVKAVKHFFVDLKLPRSVARNEQVEIKAVIHNYAPVDLHVRVVLMKTEGICSIAFKDRHTQEVTLSAGTSVAVPYTIVPFVVGKHPLEVMVVARDLMGGDRVQKTLWVVLDGVQKTEVWNTVLNPSTHGGTQTVHVPMIKPTSVVPNSVPETFINVRGHLFADSIDNSITDDSLGSLIQMPGGCVEQNLASITLPLIATLYLDRSSSWESVGIDRRVEAIRYITRGYNNQLAFRRTDGSYPPYNRQGPSTWITAYVVKVFSMAYSIIGVDLHQVCDPLVYLVKNKLRARKGDYKEDNPVYTTAMTGGLRGDDPRLTLTAFVHIALAEANQAGLVCDDSKEEVKNANKLTTQYLKDALRTPNRRPYTVAIATYALALLGEANDLHQTLLDAAAPDKSHWPDRANRLFTLEATGYALLALVKMGRMEDAKAPFTWLNSQRRRGGGFGSTQSTMVVLQALSEYMIKKPPPGNLKLDVDIRMAGRKEIKYHFNPTNSYAARSTRLPTDVDLEVLAKGNGEGILEIVTHYNQLHEVDGKASCKDFELSVDIQESSDKPPVDAEKTFQFTIKVRALGPADVRMAVLDITLPTGFTPDNSDLEKLSSSVDQYISNFQVVDNLSDRGSLIVHLFKVSHKEPEILIFRLQQNFKVGHLQPSSVTVYEYYNPDHRCSRTYTPEENKEELSRICENNVCRCTQGDCCVSKTDSENYLNKERETFACKGLLHVFKAKVLSVTLGYYDKYEMEITDVIKLGVELGVTAGQRRFFMSHIGCRDGLNLKHGSEYLIMGPKEDQWTTDTETKGYNYMLGKDTWVERWPSSAECSTNPNMQAKCKTLNDAKQDLNTQGCRL